MVERNGKGVDKMMTVMLFWISECSLSSQGPPLKDFPTPTRDCPEEEQTKLFFPWLGGEGVTLHA